MKELNLDKEERMILADVLETRLADIRMEIGNTDDLKDRDLLRRCKKVMEKTVAYLRGYRSARTDAGK